MNNQSRLRLLIFSTLVVAGVTILLPGVSPAQQQMERLFYLVDRESSIESFKKNIDKISIVAPSSYSADEDGIVWGYVDQRVTKLAKENKVGVMPLVVNPSFDQKMLHNLLADSLARRRATQSMVKLCKENQFIGIQFDFENLSITDRDGYTRFYKEAAEALHKDGFQISVAVVHRPEELPGPTRYFKWLFRNWRAGYDLKALAEIGDFVSVMSYSQHTRRTTPGPNAGIPWVRQVVEYFLTEVPAEKLSLGIPLGSQHWFTAQDDEKYYLYARSFSEGVDYARAMGLVERQNAKLNWNDEQQVPYTFYDNGGLFEYIYLEDARSFQAKLDLAKKHKLRGFSAWVLGEEDPKIWEHLDRIGKR